MITSWPNELDVAITVCDTEGTIIYMNDKSNATFAKQGKSLIGNNLKDCHLPVSWKKIKEMIAEGESNTYTVEKNGVKKLIHQAPWYEDGVLKGLVEFSIVLPAAMPHHIRG